jgi:hypothetical protein
VKDGLRAGMGMTIMVQMGMAILRITAIPSQVSAKHQNEDQGLGKRCAISYVCLPNP